MSLSSTCLYALTTLHVNQDVLQRNHMCLLTKVGEVGMGIDGGLGLDAAEKQHCNIGVHEEDQQEQRSNIVEGRQGNDKRGQQCLQPLHPQTASWLFIH